MSFSGSTTGISFQGIGSGLDTESIISRILSLDKLPVQRLQIQQAELRQHLGATEQYKSLLQKLQDAAAALNTRDAFNAIKATSSDTAVASVSATGSAQPGTFRLAVSKLAQSNKLGSAAQLDSTSQLSLAGTILVNNKSVQVVATDTLAGIASKINAVSSGVTASIVNGGVGNVFLTLTANDSGIMNKISVSDVNGGTVLQSLGVVTGAASIANPITNGAQSQTFSDSTTAIGTLMNVSVPSGNIQINGVNVAIDFATDSLSTIAANINAAGTGATASVVSETKNGATVYRLKVIGASTPTFTDANGMLENLGVLQRAPGTLMLAAQDASYSLDGINLTSSSNTVTDVIAGASFTLLKADETTPPTSTISLTRDTAAIRTKMDDLVSAYNAIKDFLDQAASFDSKTLQSGTLFGDSTIEQIQTEVFGGILQSPAGVTGTYANLLAIGVDFDSKGRMSLDSTKFENALSTNLTNVISLFTEAGTINDPDISFVSATSRTQPSGLAGYAINITQLATFGALTAGTAHTAPSTSTETLTFNGNAFGSVAYNLTVNTGGTIDDLISQINNDSKLKDIMVASKTVDDKLVLTSKRYGTPGNFNVVSDQIAAADNSGIGKSAVDAIGLDVQGTIGGEAATGSGQFLTGSTGNPHTDGLQILVRGGALGDRGVMVYTKGAAAVIKQDLDSALDFISGSITADTKGIQSQIDDLDTRIADLNTSIAAREEQLRAQFTAMEEAVSRLQAQTGQLSSLLAGLSNFNR